jgi:hypothetical protein
MAEHQIILEVQTSMRLTKDNLKDYCTFFMKNTTHQVMLRKI